MNCRRIQDLIPLFIEGDLKAGKAGPVLSHLEGCAECARIASEYRASQQWLKSYAPPDFEEEFFDKLRGGVLREIDASPSWKRRLNARLALSPASFALASAVVFGLCFGLAMYAYSNMNRELSAGEIPPYLLGEGGPAEVPGLDAGAPSDIDWRLPSVKSPAAPAREPKRGSGLAAIKHRKTPELEPAAPLAIEAEPARDVLRIELQTGDPNIRIIWFAPAKAGAEDSKPRISIEAE